MVYYHCLANQPFDYRQISYFQANYIMQVYSVTIII